MWTYVYDNVKSKKRNRLKQARAADRLVYVGRNLKSLRSTEKLPMVQKKDIATEMDPEVHDSTDSDIDSSVDVDAVEIDVDNDLQDVEQRMNQAE